MSFPKPDSVEAPEQTLLVWLPKLQVIAGKLARSRGLDEDAADDFVGELSLKLVADDYRVVRSFDGRSSVATFLRVVASRALVDYCNAQWGRWRPSAAARSLGPLAVEFERLTVRDALSAEEAKRAILTSRPTAAEDLAAAMATLAATTRVDLSTDPDPENLPAPVDERPDRSLRAHETREAMARAFRRVLASRPAPDRLLLRLRFAEGLVVREIASRLGVPARPLFRSLERVLGELRHELLDQGISPDLCLEILGSDPPFCTIDWEEDGESSSHPAVYSDETARRARP